MDWTPGALHIGAFIQRRYPNAKVYVRKVKAVTLEKFLANSDNERQLHGKRLYRWTDGTKETFDAITYNFAAVRAADPKSAKTWTDLKKLLHSLPELLEEPQEQRIQMPFALVSVLEDDLDRFFKVLTKVSTTSASAKRTGATASKPQLLSQFRDSGELRRGKKSHHVYYLAIFRAGDEPITRFVRNFRHTLNARFGHQPQYPNREEYEDARKRIERLLGYLFQQFSTLFHSADWTGKSEDHALWVETTLPVWRATDDPKPLQLHACAGGATDATKLKHITDHLNQLDGALPEKLRTEDGESRIGKTSDFFAALHADLVPAEATGPVPGNRQGKPLGLSFASIEARTRSTSEPVAAHYPLGQRIIYWFARPDVRDQAIAGLRDALSSDGWAPDCGEKLAAVLNEFRYESTKERPFILFRPSDQEVKRKFAKQLKERRPFAVHTAETRFLNYLYLYFAMFYAHGFPMCYFRSHRFTYETTREAGHIYIFSTIDPLYSPRMVHFVRQLRHLLLNINLSLQDAITRHHWKASQVRAGLSLIIARNFAHNMGSHVLSPLSLGTGWSAAGFQQSASRDFMAYLRDRADLAAEIVSEGAPPPGVAMDFVSEILVPMLQQRLLWNNLARSHGIALDDGRKPLRIAVRLKAGRNWLSFPSPAIAAETPADELDALVKDLLQSAPPVPVSMPSGAMGCQAFYMIVENFVRNCVKHGQIGDELKIVFEIEPRKPSQGGTRRPYYAVRLLCPFAGATRQQLKPVAQQLRRKLAEARVIHADGSFTGRNRGLIEMKLAATYLRRYDISAVDQKGTPPDRPPLLAPIVKAVDGKLALGYDLTLHKPLEVLCTPRLTSGGKRGRTRVYSGQHRETLLGHEAWLIRKRLAFGRTQVNIANDSLASNLATKLRKQLGNTQFADLPMLICATDGVFFGRRWKPYEREAPKASDSIANRVLKAFGLSCEIQVLLLETLFEASTWESQETFGDISVHVRKLAELKPDCTGDLFVTDHFRDPVVHQGKAYFFGRSNSALIRMFTRGTNHEKTAGDLALAALTPIVIIDERVAELAALSSGEVPGIGEQMANPTPPHWMLVPFATLLERMHIYVPTGELKAAATTRLVNHSLDPRAIPHHDQQSRDASKESIREYLAKVVEMLKPNDLLPPLLVIHQQVFDKLFGIGDDAIPEGSIPSFSETSGRRQQEATDFINDVIESGFADVIVTSGRGIPTDLPRTARYVPIASLLPYLSSHLDKVYLFKTLMAARSAYAFLD